MRDDHEFSKLADATMTQVFEALDSVDPDDVDSQLSMGVLSMEFADGTKCIMNRQVAAHQIWLAFGATAWHFDYDETNKVWVDTKGRGELCDVLAKTLGDKIGQPVRLN